MAQNLGLNVYEINGIPVKTVQKEGFPVAASQFLPYNGNNGSLYAIVRLLPSQFEYAVVETVAQLVTAANA